MVKTRYDDYEYLSINTVDHPIETSIKSSPSKSFTHRAFLIASLAQGTSEIINPLISVDTLHTLKALEAMGVSITKNPGSYIIHGTAGNIKAPQGEIQLENSGSSIRFLTSFASLANGETILTGNSRLCERPIEGLVNALHSLGVRIAYLGKQGFPPLKVLSKLKGGDSFIKGDISSQFFSSILMSAPYADFDVTINTVDLQSIKSRPYIDVTINIMKEFGIQVATGRNFFRIGSNQVYKATDYTIEGDFTNASYFFAAGAILGGSIRISGLNKNTQQGDIEFLDFMEEMGCRVTFNPDFINLERTSEDSLSGIDVNMGNYPDIIPILAIVACFATSPTRISNVKNLKFKESDRLTATITELKKVGVKIEVEEDA
ncbi:MAG: 3-phosphoshikimate 1-carboxyvinyltransferase, partial [Candidatus Hodarchaeales archaeon]